MKLKRILTITIILSVDMVYGQMKNDTLPQFTKTEILSEHSTFAKVELIDSSNLFNGLDNLIEDNTSIFTKNYGNGQLSTLSIRGNGAAQTQVFWNGFTMNPPNVGQSDLSLIPGFFVSNAFINYSGASTINGSGGIGGSLDISTPGRFKKGLHGAIGKEYASFTNFTSVYQLSFGKNRFFNELKVLHKKGINDFDYTDLSDPERPKKTQINNELNQKGVQYNLGYWINAKNKLSSSFEYFDSWREIPPYYGVTNNEFQTDKNLKSFISWKSFQRNFKTDVRFAYFEDKNHYTDSVWMTFSENDSRSLQGQARASFDLPFNFKLETSLQHIQSEAKSKDYAETKSRIESGLYIKVSQEFKKIYYEVFARQEMIDNNLSPIIAGGGIIYSTLNDRLDFKTNISTNYRTPTLNERYWNPGGNLDLLPEEGWTAELGFVADLLKNKKSRLNEFSLFTTGFYNETSNWIKWQPGANFIWSPMNVKSITNQGIEAGLGFGLHIFSKFFLNTNLSYTLTDSKNTGFADENSTLFDKRTVYIPIHKVSGRIRLSYKSFSITYNQIAVSNVFTSEDNENKLLGYFPAHVGFTYSNKFNKLHYNIIARVNNLYDQAYQVVALRPIPGRNYSISATISF